MKNVSLLLICIALVTLSFVPSMRSGAALYSVKASTPHVWQNLTPLTGGNMVTACVNFASTTDPTVTGVKIFNGSCLQFIVTGTNSGSWVVTGPGYKTSNGAAGFQITYTDENGISKTVKFSGTFISSVSSCGY